MATYFIILCYMAFLAIFSIAIHVESDSTLRVQTTSDNALRFRFYLQDRLQNPNQTVWEVARAEITSSSQSSFGLVRVVDDLITVTPDPESNRMGRAQGVITYADLEESALHTSLNMYFTWRDLEGSTLCILGRNALPESSRELAIVGGTGVFRMARGYAFSKTYSYDVETNHGVIEYEVYVYVGRRVWGRAAAALGLVLMDTF